MLDIDQLDDTERRRWDEEAWWLTLDADPKYTEWLMAETERVAASISGQRDLFPQQPLRIEQERTNVYCSEEQGEFRL